MGPKYFFLVLFEWVTWGSEYYELHLEGCVHTYIFIGERCSQKGGESHFKKYIPYNVIWKGEGGLKNIILVFKSELLNRI